MKFGKLEVVTQDLQKVLDKSMGYNKPGGKSHMSVEEHIVGMEFAIAVAEDGITYEVHEEHNSTLNTDIKWNANDIMRLLHRWPGISQEMLVRAPAIHYTMYLVYSNSNIVANYHYAYPPEMLFITDIIVHAEEDKILSLEQKEKFAARLGLKVLPIRYHGDTEVGFSRLENYANTSVIAKSNQGAGVRVKFEPRDTLDYMLIETNPDVQIHKNIDNPVGLARELASVLVSPERILKIHSEYNRHPIRQRKKFVDDFMSFIKNEMPGYITNYYDRVVAVNDKITQDQFVEMVKEELNPMIKQIASQMNRFRG